MNEQDAILERYDEWLKDGSDSAALVLHEWLEPVDGKGAAIFPPTYARPEGKKEEEWLGYNVDRFEDGSSVCQIDSVGSQANRMEPIFKREPYSRLIPQVVIKAGEHEVNLLDAGHRAADAIARFSDLAPALESAFVEVKKGNAELLARIAPTSIVFGSWDSRQTQAKLPRIVRSVIRAYNVKVLHRSAQYSTVAGEILEGGDAEVASKGPKAELGLAHVPSVLAHGGIQVLGEIRRDAILNLSALRALAAGKEGDDRDGRTLALRRYILGLSLVSFAAPREASLREGCLLVLDPDCGRESKLVKYDGTRQDYSLTDAQALEFATAAADKFGVGPAVNGSFDASLAREVMNLGEDDRKKLFKQGPITKDALKALAAKSAKKTKSKESQ